MSDDELQRDVAAELSWDPTVDAGQIAVSADDGIVTLRGAVGGLRQKREAARAARRVSGVTAVRDELQVRILNSDRREDAELRADVRQALLLDSVVPPGVDAEVKDGFVTLTGAASWRHQRDEADFVVANVPGVRGIHDDITLVPARNASDIATRIAAAFRRNALLDADDLSVSTTCFGMVTLAGVVHSWAEHDGAVAAAWAAPGVTEVDDRILVEY